MEILSYLPILYRYPFCMIDLFSDGLVIHDTKVRAFMSTFWVVVFFINIGTPSASWEEFGYYETQNACMDDAFIISLKVPTEHQWQSLIYCVEKQNTMQGVLKGETY